MSSFALIVTSPSIDSQGAASACQFANAALDGGHVIAGVFFYSAGVNNANRFQTVLSDELDLYKQWQDLASRSSVPLYVCVTAANRRGLQSQQDAQNNQVTDQYNIESPFQSVGLGEFVRLTQSADRTLQF